MGSKPPSLSHLKTATHQNLNKKISWKLSAQPLKCGKFVTVCGLFSLTYGYYMNQCKKSESELMRIAASGSLTTLACEVAFFPMDALNL